MSTMTSKLGNDYRARAAKETDPRWKARLETMAESADRLASVWAGLSAEERADRIKSGFVPVEAA